MLPKEIIGNWRFNYWLSKDKSTILTFEENGEAYTEMGTRYKWLITESNEIILYIEEYVQYRGKLIDNILTGTAYSSYSQNFWTWEAIRYVGPIIRPIHKTDLVDTIWEIKHSIPDLCDDKLTFLSPNRLQSELLGTGEWDIIDEKLIVYLANKFINITIQNIDNKYNGEAKNLAGFHWNSLLSFIKKIIKESPKPISEQELLEKLCNKFKEEKEGIRNLLSQKGVQHFYHFTDRDNIPYIRKHGGLMSWHYLESKGYVIPRPGGDEQSRMLDEEAGLQDFVRLSICSNHPMMYVCKKSGRISNPIILKIDPIVATFEKTLFSDRNAAARNHKQGGKLSHLSSLRWDIFSRDYFSLDQSEKHYYQAEIMVKTWIPIRYIKNIDEV